MEWLLKSSLGMFLLSVVAVAAAAQEIDESTNANQCFTCHGNHDVWEQDTLHLYVTADHIRADIHWQKGILCHDCHGGNPNTVNLREAHAVEDGFRVVKSPADVAPFCGYCHSDLDYMRRFKPSLQRDPVADFWTSVHGQVLKAAIESATAATTDAEVDEVAAEDHSIAEATVAKPRAADAKTRETAAEPAAVAPNKRDGASAEGVEAVALDTAAPPPMTCLACHPVHNMRVATDPLSSLHPLNLEETCGSCHREQRTGMREGVHHAAGMQNGFGAGTPLDCRRCHGEDAHRILPVDDSQSPVYLNHQVELCGGCHEEHHASYNSSIHGRGLRDSGLLVTAVCADCHGAHGIFYAADRRSTLHRVRVSQTCGECHRYIEERLNKSVHAQSDDTAGPPKSRADELSRKPKPGCVDCHQGHDEPYHLAEGYRLTLPNRCGNCHADLLLGYHVSMHGQLTRLGFEAAATCSDCHGAHDTLAISNPEGPLSPQNRLETCRQCHHDAVANFAEFNPHANHKDERRFAPLHHLYSRTDALIYLLFSFFLLHAILWYGRSLLSTLRYGRDRTLATHQTAVVRFSPQERTGYLFLLVSLMGLIFTGLPIKYSGQPWAQVGQIAGRIRVDQRVSPFLRRDLVDGRRAASGQCREADRAAPRNRSSGRRCYSARIR